MTIEPIELVPDGSAGVPVVLQHPAPGSDLDATDLARLVSQPLYNAIAYLNSVIQLDLVTYGNGRDGSVDVVSGTPLVLEKDTEFDVVRMVNTDAKIVTNGFRLKIRQLRVLTGVTGCQIVAENYEAAQTFSYTTPGTYTFTVPSGMTSFSYRAGGGDGGSGATFSGLGATSRSRGGYGGGGAVHQGSFTVAPGDTITIIVGSGGDGGQSVAVGPRTPPTLAGGPGGGKGGKATLIYRNGALKVGIPGGGGGGAGSGVTIVGTTPSTLNTQPTYGFEGGDGGRARMPSVTSASVHNGADGAVPSSFPDMQGTGGEDANNALTGGGDEGSPDASSGFATHPVDGQFGRGGFRTNQRTGQGGWGGENGNPTASRKTGGGGGGGSWFDGLNYTTTAGGGAGGVGFLAGDVTPVSASHRTRGPEGGNTTQPNGRKGADGYVTVYAIPVNVSPQPGSVSIGQPGGTGALPQPPHQAYIYGGRGREGGGEGSASSGLGSNQLMATGTPIRIAGPGPVPNVVGGTGGVKGQGASGGFGGVGGSHLSAAVREIWFEDPTANSSITIEAKGGDGNPGVAATGDGGGGGGGGGPVEFTWWRAYRVPGSINTVDFSVRSTGGVGGTGGSGTDTGNRGGGGGNGGEAGPLHLLNTEFGLSVTGYPSTTDPFARSLADFRTSLLAKNVGYTAVNETDSTPASGANAQGSSPWNGGVGGQRGLRRVAIVGAMTPL